MSDRSAIEWTESTWNPVIGCTPASPGCLNCYAARMARRLEAMGKPQYASNMGLRVATVRNGRPAFIGDVRLVPEQLTAPLRWRKPRRIFVNSMSDLFHKAVPFDFIDRVFAVMALCPQHTFQVLTKRPERMAKYLAHKVDCYDDLDTRSRVAQAAVHIGDAHDLRFTEDICDEWPLPNCWLGTSVESQPFANERIPHLLRCPAAVRFLSVEPLLRPVELRPYLGDAHEQFQPWHHPVGVCWVIVGGESGPRSRLCDIDWIRLIVRQCGEAGVPVYVKQLGRHVAASVDDFPECTPMAVADAGKGYAATYRLRDPKGSDPSEWPADLRVRQWPRGYNPAGGAA